MYLYLPFGDLHSSAMSLSPFHLEQQLKDSLCILNSIGASDLDGIKGLSIAEGEGVEMWRGYENLLKVYFNEMLMHAKSIKLKVYYSLFPIEDIIKSPWWMGVEEFHKSHRSKLIMVAFPFYFPKFHKDFRFNNNRAMLPSMDGSHTFKTEIL